MLVYIIFKVVIGREEGTGQQMGCLLVSFAVRTKVYLSLHQMKQCCYFRFFSQDDFSTVIILIVLLLSLSALTLQTPFLMTSIKFCPHQKDSFSAPTVVESTNCYFLQVFIHFKMRVFILLVPSPEQIIVIYISLPVQIDFLM